MSSMNPLVSSCFDSSKTFLASVIVALDTHLVRVNSVNPSETALSTVFNLPVDNKVSMMNWVPFQEEDQLLALGLTNGSIVLYLPFTNTIVTRISTASSSLITDFKYSSITSTFWATDISGTIYEWDLTYNLLQLFALNDSLAETSESLNSIDVIVFNSEPHLLVGSQSIYLVNMSREIIKTFPAHIQPIKELIKVPTNPDLFISYANGDRFINLYSISKQATQTVFVADSPVAHVSLGVSDAGSILIARTEAGVVEVFNSFLSEEAALPNGTNSRKKKRQMANSRSRHSDAAINLEKHEDDVKGAVTPELPIVAEAVKHNLIIYTWLENSDVVLFDSMRWIDDKNQNLVVNKLIIKKKKTDSAVPHHALYGHDVASAKHYNEGNAIVSDGYNLNNVVEDEGDEGETLAEKVAKLATNANPTTPKKVKKQGLNNNTVTTILAQSLRNNDHSLLESVLTNRDQQVIQNTIARLDASLAIVLLDRISERIARQANRFDLLIYWLKWIIIIHGGILSSLPGLSSKLSNLHAILSRKAETLPRLLQLQNKMQIIDEINEIKRSAKKEYVEDEDVDTDIEYIEELDDAKLMNGDFLSGDDYEDSDENMESESEDENGAIADEDLEVEVQDQEGYSDEEIDVNNKDLLDEDEE